MNDLISRQDAIDAIEKLISARYGWKTDARDEIQGLNAACCAIIDLPSAESEHLTDNEQRIFLAAMGREEKVCKEVDKECRNCREPYEDSLVRTCHEITRKVKGALWT